MAIKRPFKMLIYAPPGTGKSVFAAGLPNPFFICTDGNYEWLLDFGAKEDAHVDISSFAEFERLVNNDFTGYDTIVVDLLEDIYKWNEYEYCKKQKVDHLSDAGGYGKGWDITRNRLFVACSKLLSLPKNVVFLSHESSYVDKDRKGNEKTKYYPSNMMSEKFMTMLEGRLRYVLRAKFEDEVTEDGKVVMHRVLSLVPKTNEYGIIRGVNTDLMPEDIALDPQIFLQVIGYVGNDTVEEKKQIVLTQAVEPAKQESTDETATVAKDKQSALAKIALLKAKANKATNIVEAPAKAEAEVKEQTKAEEPVEEQPKAVEVVEEHVKVDDVTEAPAEVEVEVEAKAEEPHEAEKPAQKVIEVEETVEAVAEPIGKPESQADKIAKIKAKLAAKKKL